MSNQVGYYLLIFVLLFCASCQPNNQIPLPATDIPLLITTTPIQTQMPPVNENVEPFSPVIRPCLLLNGSFPFTSLRWSPNGNYLIFTSLDNHFLHLVNVAGNLTNTQTNKITLLADFSTEFPVWSPTEPLVAFMGVYPNGVNNRRIYIMNVENNQRTPLFVGLDIMPWPIEWSLDGKYLFFIVSDGGENRYVRGDIYRNEITYLSRVYPYLDGVPAWSLNKLFIAFAAFDPLRPVSEQTSDIFITDENGENKRQLTNNDSCDINPVWSPDGKQIAYFSQETGSTDIFLLNVDSFEKANLTQSMDEQEVWLDWSSNGEAIVYTTEEWDNPSKLYVLDVVNYERRLLVETQTYNELLPKAVWSPNGSTIAFWLIDLEEGSGSLDLIRWDGSGRTRLATFP